MKQRSCSAGPCVTALVAICRERKEETGSMLVNAFVIKIIYIGDQFPGYYPILLLPDNMKSSLVMMRSSMTGMVGAPKTIYTCR